MQLFSSPSLAGQFKRLRFKNEISRCYFSLIFKSKCVFHFGHIFPKSQFYIGDPRTLSSISEFYIGDPRTLSSISECGFGFRPRKWILGRYLEFKGENGPNHFSLHFNFSHSIFYLLFSVPREFPYKP